MHVSDQGFIIRHHQGVKISHRAISVLPSEFLIAEKICLVSVERTCADIESDGDFYCANQECEEYTFTLDTAE